MVITPKPKMRSLFKAREPAFAVPVLPRDAYFQHVCGARLSAILDGGGWASWVAHLDTTSILVPTLD